MNKGSKFQLFVFTALIAGSAVISFGQPKRAPRVFLLDRELLVRRQTEAADPDMAGPAVRAALAKIDADAKRSLSAVIDPVTAKDAAPPSGDKHDYMSQAPYFWRNPKTADGMPYIRRDGERNPEIAKFPDHGSMDKMIDAVDHLSLGYYLTRNEAYAGKAAEILRMWFIDPKTKMNPNLDFAQAIPGQNTGRGIGIIETRGLVRVVDAVGLLDGSRAWKEDDQTQIVRWFEKYLAWLMDSKNGRDEEEAKNNHGTFYDVQAASFALFAGKTDLAKHILDTAKNKRIAVQIEPDGRQPLELARTKSWSYSTMNLDGLVSLAQLGDTAGVDLWSFQTADGRGIRKAIEFLEPYARGGNKWTFEQIEPLRPESLYTIMRRAARGYRDEKYSAFMQAVPKPPDSDRSSILVQEPATGRTPAQSAVGPKR
jgi:hypothetical protein